MVKSWDAPGWDVKSYRSRINSGEAINLYRGEGKGQYNKKLIRDFAKVTYIFHPDERFARFSPDFSIVVTIGIDTNESHISLSGDSIPYYALIASLNFFGFDPLYAAKSDEALNSLWRKAEGYFRRINASNNINIGSVRMMAGIGLGTAATEYAKDYVRGKTSFPKHDLAPETIETRKWKAENYTGLYRGERGINEPLWESGQLEEAIRVLKVEVIGSLVKRDRAPRGQYYDKSPKDVRRTMKQKPRRVVQEEVDAIVMRRITSNMDENTRKAAARDNIAIFRQWESAKIIELTRRGMTGVDLQRAYAQWFTNEIKNNKAFAPFNISWKILTGRAAFTINDANFAQHIF